MVKTLSAKEKREKRNSEIVLKRDDKSRRLLARWNINPLRSWHSRRERVLMPFEPLSGVLIMGMADSYPRTDTRRWRRGSIFGPRKLIGERNGKRVLRQEHKMSRHSYKQFLRLQIREELAHPVDVIPDYDPVFGLLNAHQQ